MVYILGIESTCDESGICLLEGKEKKVRILANELRSQIKVHSPYGGIVPILAAREHKKNLPLLLENIKNFFDLKIIDYLAFSIGPGLLPALVEGKNFVQKLAKDLNKKIIPVNHLEAHFFSTFIKNKIGVWQKIKNIEFPSLVLVVSGGHTNLYFFKNPFEKKKLGSTLDDAAGESLDKSARALGLGYPGGPLIEKLAQKGQSIYYLPKPLLERGYNFSFSGLKTAFIDLIKELKETKGELSEEDKRNLAASFQKTLFETLIYKLKKAVNEFKPKSLIVTGGVIANKTLRKMIKFVFPKYKIYFPDISLSTDNGVNIAISAYFLLEKKEKILDYNKIEVFAREK